MFVFFWIQESAHTQRSVVFLGFDLVTFGCTAKALTDLIMSDHAITLIFAFKRNNKPQEARAMQPLILNRPSYS